MKNKLTHKSILFVFISLTNFLLAQNKQPNILVFLIDDFGVMDSSVPFLTNHKNIPQTHPLNEFYSTPNIDRLAKKGKRFSNFYAMSVCSPSRISLLTGTNSARHHTTQWVDPVKKNRERFAPNWKWTGINRTTFTLPKALSKIGYKTIHVGKAHFAPFKHEGETPTDLGFQVNIAGGSIGRPASYYGKHHYGGIPNKKGKVNIRHVKGLEAYYKDDVNLTEALTQEMKHEIKKSVADKQPFFAYMAHYGVHGPFMEDKRFSYLYNEKVAKADFAKNKKQFLNFATMVSATDKSLGDLMDLLEELNVADNTLIVFLGDNGSDAPIGNQHTISVCAPLRGKKGAKYEGGTRVPGIIAWAKESNNTVQKEFPIHQGINSKHVARIHDIFPTIQELTGFKNSTKIDGASLWTVLKNKKSFSTNDTFLLHFPHDHNHSYFSTYRNKNWKLIYNYFPKENQPKIELYNLDKDISESNNLAKKEPKKVKVLFDEMLAQLKEKKAQFPVQNNQVIKPSL